MASRKPNPRWKIALTQYVFDWLCFAYTQGPHPWWEGIMNKAVPPPSYARSVGWQRAAVIVTAAFSQTSITSIPPCGVDTKLWGIYNELTFAADEMGKEPAYVAWAGSKWTHSQHNFHSSSPSRHFDAGPYALSLAANRVHAVIQDYVCKHKWGTPYSTSEYGITYDFHKCKVCSLEVELEGKL